MVLLVFPRRALWEYCSNLADFACFPEGGGPWIISDNLMVFVSFLGEGPVGNTSNLYGFVSFS